MWNLENESLIKLMTYLPIECFKIGKHENMFL